MAFDWKDETWRGRSWNEAVIYELHVAPSRKPGTFSAAKERLDYLAELGVTAIELMRSPIFPACGNGVTTACFPFAPDSTYGRPEELKRIGASRPRPRHYGFCSTSSTNHLARKEIIWAPTPRSSLPTVTKTPWGNGINSMVLKAGSFAISSFTNALYWLTEYQSRRMRLDAVHAILDDSTPDILAELATTVGTPLHQIGRFHLILENERNQSIRLRTDSAVRTSSL